MTPGTTRRRVAVVFAGDPRERLKLLKALLDRGYNAGWDGPGLLDVYRVGESVRHPLYMWVHIYNNRTFYLFSCSGGGHVGQRAHEAEAFINDILCYNDC